MRDKEKDRLRKLTELRSCGELPGHERDVVVIGARTWPGRHLRFWQEQRLRQSLGYELIERYEGPEGVLFDEGRCPTLDPSAPSRLVIVGVFRLTSVHRV